MIEMMELVDKDFKTTIVNFINIIKENLDTMREMEDLKRDSFQNLNI